jgi:hypothetical protein
LTIAAQRRRQRHCNAAEDNRKNAHSDVVARDLKAASCNHMN